MSVLLVSQAEVPGLLPMDECIDAMGLALQDLAAGRAEMPLRTIMWLPDGHRAFASMPSYSSRLGALALKVITVIPSNLGTELDSHQGAVLLFEADRGRLLAIVDATAITAIRTAAVSGVATRMLARQDAGDLAILGTGTQASTHLQAMLVVRPVRRVRVWSRSGEHARAFAEREGARHGVQVEVVASAEEAVRGASLICTATSSREPVLRGEWLAAGSHVNAIGAVGPTSRELDTLAVVRARLFVDRRESAVAEAGEVAMAKAEGAIADDHIAGEIGELLAGTVRGRTSPEEITLFRGVGLAIEDLAAAHHIYTRASEAGGGKPIELGGTR